jgi:cytochrome P450
MQLFDDLEDFGAFDDAVSGDVRDPYAGLAAMQRLGPVQRLDTSGMPHDESKPVFLVYRYDEIAEVLRDNQTFSSSIIVDIFGDVFGRHVMLGMDEPEHRRGWTSPSTAAIARWSPRRSRSGPWRAGRTSGSNAWPTS